MTPCKAFGHTEGLRKNGGCIACHRLYSCIRNYMMRWYYRIICERPTVECYHHDPIASRRMFNKFCNRYHRQQWEANPEYRMKRISSQYKQRLTIRIAQKKQKIAQLEEMLNA